MIDITKSDTAWQAREAAIKFCREFPLKSDDSYGPTTERIHFHAIMEIIRGLDQDKRDAIAALYVEATHAEYQRGWSRGWNASYKSTRSDA